MDARCGDNTKTLNSKKQIWLLLCIEQMFIRLKPTPKSFKN